jgi:hypothetical protein
MFSTLHFLQILLSPRFLRSASIMKHSRTIISNYHAKLIGINSTWDGMLFMLDI